VLVTAFAFALLCSAVVYSPLTEWRCQQADQRALDGAGVKPYEAGRQAQNVVELNMLKAHCSGLMHVDVFLYKGSLHPVATLSSDEE
jgi:hypothetical protein